VPPRCKYLLFRALECQKQLPLWIHSFQRPQKPLFLFLTRVRVEFLPANTTSVCQPLDQGIIRTFKAYYKKRWLQYQLDNYEAGEDPHGKMNVLQALRWVTEAWREDVTETTIAVYLTPTLMGQKYPFLSLSPFHRHLVRLVPCGPLPSSKRRTIPSSFGS